MRLLHSRVSRCFKYLDWWPFFVFFYQLDDIYPNLNWKYIRISKGSNHLGCNFSQNSKKPCHLVIQWYFQTSSLEICSLQWYAEFLSPKLYVVQGRILHRDPRMESLKSKLMEERQEMVKALEEHHSALRIFVPCFQMVFILYLYHFISICYVFACLSIMFIYL